MMSAVPGCSVFELAGLVAVVGCLAQQELLPDFFGDQEACCEQMITVFLLFHRCLCKLFFNFDLDIHDKSGFEKSMRSF